MVSPNAQRLVTHTLIHSSPWSYNAVREWPDLILFSLAVNCYLKCTPAKWKFSVFFPTYQLPAMKMWNKRFYSLLHWGISQPHAVRRTTGWYLCQQSQHRLQPVPGIPLTMERKLSINQAHILAQRRTEMQTLIRMNTSIGDDKLDKWQKGLAISAEVSAILKMTNKV